MKKKKQTILWSIFHKDINRDVLYNIYLISEMLFHSRQTLFNIAVWDWELTLRFHGYQFHPLFEIGMQGFQPSNSVYIYNWNTLNFDSEPWPCFGTCTVINTTFANDMRFYYYDLTMKLFFMHNTVNNNF